MGACAAYKIDCDAALGDGADPSPKLDVIYNKVNWGVPVVGFKTIAFGQISQKSLEELLFRVPELRVIVFVRENTLDEVLSQAKGHSDRGGADDHPIPGELPGESWNIDPSFNHEYSPVTI